MMSTIQTAWSKALRGCVQQIKASLPPFANRCSFKDTELESPRLSDKTWPKRIRALRKFCSRIRKIVEIVGSHPTERFAVSSIRVRDLWHFHHRLIRKVLAHTVMVFLNLQLGRDPLDLDGLVSA